MEKRCYVKSTKVFLRCMSVAWVRMFVHNFDCVCCFRIEPPAGFTFEAGLDLHTHTPFHFTSKPSKGGAVLVAVVWMLWLRFGNAPKKKWMGFWGHGGHLIALEFSCGLWLLDWVWSILRCGHLNLSSFAFCKLRHVTAVVQMAKWTLSPIRKWTT